MADQTSKQSAGLVGVGGAACAACCAPPIIGFLAAASVGTLIGVALFGIAGLAVLAVIVVMYLRRRPPSRGASAEPTPVTLGRKADA